MAYRIDVEIGIFTTSSSILPANRARLVANARSWGADYILWLDADHTFPPHTLATLLAHNLPIVGVNYPRRAGIGEPLAPTAKLGPLVGVCTTEEAAKKGKLQQVESLGLGVCLMRTEVFDVISKPYFLIAADETGENYVGEDVWFFRKLKEAGVPVFVDHGLSWEVGHISETVLRNADVQGRRVKDANSALPAAGP